MTLCLKWFDEELKSDISSWWLLMKLMYGAKLQYHKENEEMVVKAIKEIGLEASADNPTAKYVTVIRNQNNEQMQNTWECFKI